ncbi:3beta-hydroxysteroid-dehydrogenase/decarboxylase isoform 3-like protein [Drosera capensis]
MLNFTHQTPSPAPAMTTTCVVIGGQSFVGGAFVRRLLRLGTWTIVRIADSSPSSPPSDHSDAVIADAVSDGPVDGSSVVFHVISTIGAVAHDPYQCYTYIVQESEVERMIFNSSADVVFDGLHGVHYVDESLKYPLKYGDMLNDFMAQAELLVLGSNNYKGLLTCALRPSLVFGPADPHILPLLMNQANSSWAKFVLGNGDNLCDFTYVENVAHAHICTAEALMPDSPTVTGKAFYITNLAPVNYWYFVSQIYEGVGYQRPVIKIPDWMLCLILPLFTWLYNQLGSEFSPQLTSIRFAIQSASFTRTFNCSAAQEKIGYSPVVSLEEAVGLTTQSHSHTVKDSMSSRCTDLNDESNIEKLLGGGKVADVLLWRDERETFTYFLALVALIYWLFLGGRTFISSASQLLLLATLFLFVHNALAMNIFGRTYLEIPLAYFQVSDTSMKDILDTFARFWNEGVHTAKSLAQGEDWNRLLKVAVPLYFLKLMLSLPLTALLAIALVIAFTSFFTYEQYEKELNAFMRIAHVLGGKVKLAMIRNLPASLSPLLNACRSQEYLNLMQYKSESGASKFWQFVPFQFYFDDHSELSNSIIC